MKRFMTPMAEVFVLLSLTFYSLLFISAALTGQADETPQDKLHLVSLTWKLPDQAAPHFGKGYPGDWWLMKGITSLAVTDRGNLELRKWTHWWAHPIFSSKGVSPSARWQSRLTKDGCEDIETGSPHFLDAYEHVVQIPPGTSPEKILRNLSNSDDSISIHYHEEWSDAEGEYSSIFKKPLDEIVLIPPKIQNAGISIAYRPEDIGRETYLELAILYDLEFWHDFYTDSFANSGFYVVYSSRDPINDKLEELKIDFSQDRPKKPDSDLSRSEATNISHLTNMPGYYTDKDCNPSRFHFLRLFVSLTHDGPILSFEHPLEIE